MFEKVLHFWFEEIEIQQQWQKDPAFDAMIAERFGEFHSQANRCELAHWRNSPEGRLAEIIVLDQFSRNIYRDTAAAFASDSLALALSQMAIQSGDDKQLEVAQKSFLYMPFMHSESALIHQQSVELFQQEGLEKNYEFELKHKVIIDRFGRYPHRNTILGRQSTAEEIEFLQQPGSSF